MLRSERSSTHERPLPKSIPEDIISIIDSCLEQYYLTPDEAACLETTWLERGELPEHIGYIAIDGVVRWYERP